MLIASKQQTYLGARGQNDIGPPPNEVPAPPANGTSSVSGTSTTGALASITGYFGPSYAQAASRLVVTRDCPGSSSSDVGYPFGIL